MEYKKRLNGTAVVVTYTCRCCKKTQLWTSQPDIGDTPAGNILLSTAVVCAGATISKVRRVFHHLSVPCIATRTCHRHQREFIFTAVEEVWQDEQKWLIASLQAENRGLVLGGDGRADSPGHSAKFGTYTTMELAANVVLDINVVQVIFSAYIEIYIYLLIR